jgi:hypothetical protein
MTSVFNQARAAEPMDDRPQHGPLREVIATREIGEPGGPIMAMRTIPLHPPHMNAYCIGYWYHCGCELRGSGPFYGWQFCQEHASLAREYPEIERLAEYGDGVRMTFEQAEPDANKPGN